jgi:hypothetical protein
LNGAALGLRVARRVLDQSMAEPILDAPRVVAGVGQGVATSVTEHMSLGLDAQASRGDGSLDHNRRHR